MTGITAGILLGFVVGFALATSIHGVIIKEMAIDSGCAAYNTQTGEFRYIAKCPWEKR